MGLKGKDIHERVKNKLQNKERHPYDVVVKIKHLVMNANVFGLIALQRALKEVYQYKLGHCYLLQLNPPPFICVLFLMFTYPTHYLYNKVKLSDNEYIYKGTTVRFQDSSHTSSFVIGPHCI